MRLKNILVVVTLLLLVTAPVWSAAAPASVAAETTGAIQVSYLDVGQGDAALLQDSTGTDILIDGGPASAGPTVTEAIRARTDKSLEAILITHADADHSAGVISVLQATDISVTAIYYNGYPGSTQTWSRLVSQAAARAIPMLSAQFPAVYQWGEFSAYILNPAQGLVNPETNDASVVARIDFKSSRFLFTGDIDSTIEATVVARQTPVAADVLKVAHHGSASSSSASFLAAVMPTYAVISVGADNTYGHPAAATLTRLNAAGIQVWRTDQAGTIVVTSSGADVQFPAQPPGHYWLFLPQVQRD